MKYIYDIHNNTEFHVDTGLYTFSAFVTYF